MMFALRETEQTEEECLYIRGGSMASSCVLY